MGEISEGMHMRLKCTQSLPYASNPPSPHSHKHTHNNAKQNLFKRGHNTPNDFLLLKKLIAPMAIHILISSRVLNSLWNPIQSQKTLPNLHLQTKQVAVRAVVQTTFAEIINRRKKGNQSPTVIQKS